MTPMGADAALFDVVAAAAAEVVVAAAEVFGSPGAAVVTPAGGVEICYEVRERSGQLCDEVFLCEAGRTRA